MEIRAYVDGDWGQVHPIVQEIVAAEDTYAYDPRWSEQQLRDVWVEPPPGRTVVAVDDQGMVLGTAKMGPNRPGPGDHIATGSYMVPSVARGRGVGRALGEHSIEWARSAGFHGIQFNAVVSSNTSAVRLWQSLGFRIVGTVPDAFRHPRDGLVDLHVMYLKL